MKAPSPTLEGFRVMFRYPFLGMAEIAWRWSLGAAAFVLLSFALLQYLDTLPVSNGDLLCSRQPFLISQAIAHIFRGSGFRFAVAMGIALAAIAVAWIAAASAGRATTLQWLMKHFQALKLERQSAAVSEEGVSQAAEEPASRELLASPAEESAIGLRPLASLARLNFLRVALILAGALGSIGAIILVTMASSARQPHPGLAFLMMVPLVCLVWLFWSVLNWFLSLASVFVMRDHQNAFASVSSAVDFFRARMGAVISAGFWFGLAHLTAFMVATTLVSLPLAFAGAVPFGVVLGGVLMVTLLYFATADFLYAGRLAAYVAIAESEDAPATEAGIVPASTPSPALQLVNTSSSTHDSGDVHREAPLPPPASEPASE